MIKINVDSNRINVVNDYSDMDTDNVLEELSALINALILEWKYTYINSNKIENRDKEISNLDDYLQEKIMNEISNIKYEDYEKIRIDNKDF